MCARVGRDALARHVSTEHGRKSARVSVVVNSFEPLRQKARQICVNCSGYERVDERSQARRDGCTIPRGDNSKHDVERPRQLKRERDTDLDRDDRESKNRRRDASSRGRLLHGVTLHCDDEELDRRDGAQRSASAEEAVRAAVLREEVWCAREHRPSAGRRSRRQLDQTRRPSARSARRSMKVRMTASSGRNDGPRIDTRTSAAAAASDTSWLIVLAASARVPPFGEATRVQGRAQCGPRRVR